MFGRELPMIKAQANSYEIQEWKKKPEVGRCYSKLFKRTNTDQPETYMTRIIERLWRDKQGTPNIHISFAISVAEAYLNPANQVV